MEPNNGLTPNLLKGRGGVDPPFVMSFKIFNHFSDLLTHLREVRIVYMITKLICSLAFHHLTPFEFTGKHLENYFTVSSTKNRIELFHGEKDETPKRLPFAGVHDFDFSILLGSGGFGAVFKAQRRSTGIDYALKVQPIEALARSTRSIARRETDETLVHMERTVLACCREHPFIVNLEYAFYTDKHAILALEYIPGKFGVYVRNSHRMNKAN